jgi:hypothetical protein
MGAPGTFTTPEGEILGRRDWRLELARQYQPIADRLISAYTRLLPRLHPYASDLTAELRRRADAGLPLTPDFLRSIPSYGKLLARTQAELDDFAALVRLSAGETAQGAVGLGSEAALDLTLASAGNGAGIVSSAWLRPTPETLGRLIGFADSEAFRGRWARFGESAAQQLGDILISGVAQGMSPARIARLWGRWQNVPYHWAETATRTAQLWSYRLGSHAGYLSNSRMIQGWVWWSAREVRTCISCWAQHGSFHTLDDFLQDHHRGRCTELPVLRGATWHERLETGETIFGRLPAQDQRAVMGKGLFEAYQRGDARFSEFSRPYQDDIYGEMLRGATLTEMGIR